MKSATFHRLHDLRNETVAAGYRMDELRPRFSALATRHEDGTAPQAISAHQLFQTPPALAKRLVEALGIAPDASPRVLEPSAGLGRILDALAPLNPRQVVAIEQSKDCARELFKRETVHLYQRDFLTVTPAEIGLFNVVCMNPPFTMRSDIRHILHALTFLAPNGILAALCMDTPHREKVLRHLSATWKQIPAGTFRSEGTEVPTILLTIKN